MNFMAESVDVYFEGELSIDGLRAELERKLVLRSEVFTHESELGFAARSYASVRLRSPYRGLVESAKSSLLARRLEHSVRLEIVTGPNHRLSAYLSMFCDLQLAILQMPGIYIVSTGEGPFEITGDSERDSPILGSFLGYDFELLLDLVANDDEDAEDREEAAMVALRMARLLPRECVQQETLDRLSSASQRLEVEDPLHELVYDLLGCLDLNANATR